MTGTVLDGNIDVALLRTDGETVEEIGGFGFYPYQGELNELLRDTLRVASDWQFNGPEPDIFRKTEQQITQSQAAAVEQFLGESGYHKSDIACIGFHGQSVLHRPPLAGVHGRTRQLGDGTLMADLLGIPVVNDFRSADMAAGGHGAPLAPVYHAALLRALQSHASKACNPLNSEYADIAILNLGGVGNLTWWDGADELIAFDCGPANAPINDFVRSRGLGAFDVDGNLAAQGEIDERLLGSLFNADYFKRPYPKSLDRNSFTADIAHSCEDADGAALLTAFAAGSVSLALDLLPRRPLKLIVCGGGRRNKTLVREIGQRSNVETLLAEEVGWNGDAVEAECFAYLGVRALRGLPISYPSTTGARSAITGGVISQPH